MVYWVLRSLLSKRESCPDPTHGSRWLLPLPLMNADSSLRNTGSSSLWNGRQSRGQRGGQLGHALEVARMGSYQSLTRRRGQEDHLDVRIVLVNPLLL